MSRLYIQVHHSHWWICRQEKNATKEKKDIHVSPFILPIDYCLFTIDQI